MSSTDSSQALIRFDAVVKHYRQRQGLSGVRIARAVDGVGLAIDAGETLGLVGESGCGKSTLARLALKLEAPSAGRVLFEGADLALADAAALNAYRRSVQAVFQDPFSSLNPRMRCGEIVAEPLVIRGGRSRREIDSEVTSVLEKVGLPADSPKRFAHQFSGGQRQRIAIARALVLRPRLVVLDEPISALDVSIRAQILNLLAALKADYGVAYLFIAHDLHAVAALSDRIAVMYLGEIVETGPADQVAAAPRHPYTRMLFAATTADMPSSVAAVGVAPKGEPPSAFAPPAGCRFHPRCPLAQDQCRYEAPLPRALYGHTIACHFA
ncbi:MAG: ATP-binding cassette domain-containing protein [Burkholderiales bacterium]|nr:ATP-binding cassette domain-containing protein [Burkholderiales bacterium]